MMTMKSPGAHHSDRGQEIISGEMLPNITAKPISQRHRITWTVNRWLMVCEVRHDR